MPWPEDPTLAAYAKALNGQNQWAVILDDQWRYVFETDERRRLTGELGLEGRSKVGDFWFGPNELADVKREMTAGDPVEGFRQGFLRVGPHILADLRGGREELRSLVDPVLADLVDTIVPVEHGILSSVNEHVGWGSTFAIQVAHLRVRDFSGRVVGNVVLSKPDIPMNDLASATAAADPRHLERLRQIQRPERRPAAILFADLEASSPLSRRLSTAHYFAFGRRLIRAADQCLIDHGAIVGSHLGDGVCAIFLVETADSESAAVVGCITAARALRGVIDAVAARSDLADEELTLRFGLHWGSSLYVGRVQTGARSEAATLGDPMNEAARIEACATGARALASKELIERLTRDDAQTLGIDLDRVTYTPLAALTTATDKARRDAPAIAVCDV